MNDCTFNNLCENLSCHYKRCIHDFDRRKYVGYCEWEGDYCDINIDECQRGNNCSKGYSKSYRWLLCMQMSSKFHWKI